MWQRLREPDLFLSVGQQLVKQFLPLFGLGFGLGSQLGSRLGSHLG